MQVKRSYLSFFINQKILFILLLLFIYLAIFNRSFFAIQNLLNILNQISIDGIIAIGMTYLLISRELDLSVGSNLAATGAVSVLISIKYGVILGYLGGVIFGTLMGFVIGLIVTKLKVNSIAVTLGMMGFLRGFVLFLTKSETVRGTNPNFTFIGEGYLFKISYATIIYFVLLIIFGIILSKTFFGRNLYAIGGNEEASRFFGINVEKNKLWAFILTGFLTGIAGVVVASRLNIGSGALGIDTPITVIIAVILGGASLSGGEGSLFKTFQGVLLFGVIANSLQLMQIDNNLRIVIKGLLLIIVLMMDAWYVKFRRYRFI